GDYTYGMTAAGAGNVLVHGGIATIATSGGSAHGVFVIGDDHSVRHEGSIVAGPGPGVALPGARYSLYNLPPIAASGPSAAVQLHTGSTSFVTNRGSITSAAACVSGTAAGATSVVSSGVLDCGGNAVTLGAGNDDVTLAGNSITHGDIDLGGGDDLLALEVDAGLAGRLDGSLLGAETLHKNGAGAIPVAGDAEVGFTSAHVNAGTLVL